MYFSRAMTLLCLLLATVVTASPIPVRSRPQTPTNTERVPETVFRGATNEEANKILNNESVVPKGKNHPKGPVSGPLGEQVVGHVLGRNGKNNEQTSMISTTPRKAVAKGFVNKDPNTQKPNGALLQIKTDALSADTKTYNANREFKKLDKTNPFGDQHERVVKGDVDSSSVKTITEFSGDTTKTKPNPNFGSSGNA